MWEKGGVRQWSLEHADMNGGAHEVGAWHMGWCMDASVWQRHTDGTRGLGDVSGGHDMSVGRIDASAGGHDALVKGISMLTGAMTHWWGIGAAMMQWRWYR